MEYSVPYILLICFYGILALWYHTTNDATRRGSIVLLCAVVFLTFFGFRGFCFFDWNAYYPGFQSITEDLHMAVFVEKWYEPGFTALMVICKQIYDNYQFFVFVCCLIDTVLLTRFLSKYVSNVPFGFIIFLCMGGLGLTTDLLRNAIAILIFMNAIQYIETRRPIPYFTACLVAISFHLSAIIYLPLYFILHRNWTRWGFASIFLIGNIILILHIPILKSIISLFASFIDPTTQQYIDEYTSLLPAASFQISIGFLERLFTFGLIFIYYNKLKEVQRGHILLNSMSLFFFMLLLLSEFRTVSIRMSMLFAFAYAPIWIDLIKCFSKPRNRILYVVIISLYCFIKMYSSTNSIIYHYDNALLGADSFNTRKAIYQRNYDEK